MDSATPTTYELTLSGPRSETIGGVSEEREIAIRKALDIARRGVREGRCRTVVLARRDARGRREIALFQPADLPEDAASDSGRYELYNPRHPETLIGSHDDLVEATLAAAHHSQDEGPDRPVCVRIAGVTGAILSFRPSGPPARAAA